MPLFPEVGFQFGIWRLWDLGTSGFQDLRILGFQVSWDLRVLGFLGLGLFRFLWITLGSPHSQRWVSPIFIVTREAVPARRVRCLVRCLCSHKAFAESCE